MKSNRRRFLQLNSAAVAAGLWSPRSSRAAPSTKSLSKARPIGFSLYGMETTMREVIPHTGFVHVKDVALWKPVRFLFPGEGTIDWVKYFRIIRELNYSGPILVEVSAHIHRLSKYEPLPSAELCYGVLSKARDAAYSD